MHPDHIGLARRVIGISGARLLMHEVELAYLNDVVAGGTWAQDGLRFAGVPGSLASKILRAVGAMREIVRSLHPDAVFHGGETIPTEYDELEVVWTPGHSPGHICLYGRQSKTLFSGDHILTDITPNISWARGRDTLSDFLSSLRKLAPYDIELILPAHGEPFDGHREWIDETIRHHDERSAIILGGMASGPRTAHELVASVWPEPFGPFNHYFAVFEVLAHLEHMRRNGRVTCEQRTDDAALWRSASL
jgi:glyoxylase-like metal-dependent hydrolase (beta-lactamase superfamily II)